MRGSAVLAAASIAVAVAGCPRGSERAAGATVRHGLAEPLPRTPGTIRLATYNVENLFDALDDPSLSGEDEDAGMGISDARCRALAGVIRSVDADVLALQEVESLACLLWFRDTYLADAAYAHVAELDAGGPRGVEPGVLSRFPIAAARNWAGTGDFGCSPLRVDVAVTGGYELTLFVVHAPPAGVGAAVQEAEARRLVGILERLRAADAGRNVVVLGDFNAGPSDASVRAFLDAGFADPLGHRSRAGPDEERLFATRTSGLTVDFVLLNDAVQREAVPGSAHVVGTPSVEGFDPHDAPYPAGHASDHYPVVIDLQPVDRD